MKTLILFCLIPLLSFSAIWEPLNSWDDLEIDWETKFSEWMQSDSVNKNLFYDETSVYGKIKVDCADVMYLMRAIFSYENSLDFKVMHPLFAHRRVKKYYSHSMSNWNYLPQEEKVSAFLRYLADNLGTEALSRNDSYSVAPKDIKPGDFFMFKAFLDPNSNMATRHSFMIKDITSTGLFDVIYSTQRARDNDKPMYYRKNHMFSAPLAPTITGWGFKRFKKPSEYQMNNSNITAYDDSQYDIVSNNSGAYFFKYVQSVLKQSNETPENKVERLFTDLCQRLDDRVEAVNDATIYRKKIDYRCMNASEYDIYSTPLRDSRIKAAFEDVEIYLNTLDDTFVNSRFLQMLRNIFDQGLSSIDLKELEIACPIQIKDDETMDLNTFYSKLINDEISNNPNDPINARWGFEPSTSNCRKY